MRKPHNLLKGRVTSLNFIGSYEFISKIHNKKSLRQTVRFWDIHIKNHDFGVSKHGIKEA